MINYKVREHKAETATPLHFTPRVTGLEHTTLLAQKQTLFCTATLSGHGVGRWKRT